MVEWDDSFVNTDWHPIGKGYEGISECVTFGVLIEEGAKSVTVVPSISNTSGQVVGTMSIPRGCIKRIRSLKVA